MHCSAARGRNRHDRTVLFWRLLTLAFSHTSSTGSTSDDYLSPSDRRLAAIMEAIARDKEAQQTYYEIDDLTDKDDAKLEQLLQDVSPINAWTHLYIFADRFDVPNFRELIVESIRQLFVPNPHCPTHVDIALAFRSLPISSPLCGLYVDIFSTTWDAASDQRCPIEQTLRGKVPSSFYFIIAAKGSRRFDRSPQ